MLLAAVLVAAVLAEPNYSNATTTYAVTPFPGFLASCAASAPCALSHALTDLANTPLLQKPWEIDLGPGDYSDCAQVWVDFPTSIPAAGSWLWLRGPAQKTAVVATGPTSGTATASALNAFPSRATVTDAAATWTVNDLRGKYACLGGVGCPLGKWPIESNSATVLTLEAGALPAGGLGQVLSGLGGTVTYSLTQPAARFTGRCTVPPPTAYPVSLAGAGLNLDGELSDFQMSVNAKGPLGAFNVYLTDVEFVQPASTRSLRVSGAAVVTQNVTFTEFDAASAGIACFGSRCSVAALRDVWSNGTLILGGRDADLGFVLPQSNVGLTPASKLDARARLSWVGAVYNAAVNPVSRSWYLSFAADGIIAADFDSGGVGDFTLFTNRSTAHQGAVHLMLDGENWSMASTGQCLVNASGYLQWDESGVASTGSSAGKNAAVCLGGSADVRSVHRTAGFAMTGSLSGSAKSFNWGAGAVLKSTADVAGAGNASVCDPPSPADGGTPLSSGQCVCMAGACVN